MPNKAYQLVTEMGASMKLSFVHFVPNEIKLPATAAGTITNNGGACSCSRVGYCYH